jgi:hypothetical protein
MKRSIRVTKKPRGRPKTTGTGVQIGMRWQEPTLAKIDAWIAGQGGKFTRSEAIRRLVEQALAAQPKKAAKR